MADNDLKVIVKAKEKRLIDVNLLKGVIQKCIEEKGPGLFSDVMRKVCDVLDVCPTVDAVEVVRCKKCKFAEKDEIHKMTLRCTRFRTGMFTHRMLPESFCSYGERKDDV